MRAGGGNRDNPSATEFAAEYRKITVENLFDHVRGSNCNLDAGEFLLKLNQLQRASSSTQNSPHFLNMPNILPISINVSILEENCVVSLSVVICNYIRRNYCESCANLVCLNISSNFSNIHLLSMDKLKNIDINRIQPKPLFVEYINKLSVLFNHYINDIIYKNDICKLFNNIVTVNNVCFTYCNSCLISDSIICYFVKCRLSTMLSKENLNNIDCKNTDMIRKSRKLIKLKHL